MISSLTPLLFLAHAAGAVSAAADEPSHSPEAIEFFERKVRPLLTERCLECHSAKKKYGGLRLDSRAAVLKGSDNGPAAVPGRPEQSALVRAIGYGGEIKMPPKGKLPDADVRVLTEWVKLGLPWPDASTTAKTGEGMDISAKIADAKKNWWAFQPVRAVGPPEVRDRAWPAGDVDRFILAALEAKGLTPAPAAQKRALIRRAGYDLTGLPPTPEEIAAFLSDETPEAFAKVVDRLLASPHYGEKWGRHWLDLVRYTDSLDARGSGGTGDITEAYKYRDWVVRSFNADMPYDRFLIHQIAGDLLPSPNPGTLYVDGRVATGVLAIGEWGAGDADKDKMMTDIVDDQIDLVGRTILGLTLACARCHDHKFDPISVRDYYGLAGVFFSSHVVASPGVKTQGTPVIRIPLAQAGELKRQEEYKAALASAEKKLKATSAELFAGFAKSMLPQTAAYVTAAWEHRNRPEADKAQTLEQFAGKRGLHAFALRRFAEAIGAPKAEQADQPFTVKVEDVAKKAGVHGRRGKADCPSMVANTNDVDVKILTFTLPAKSISVHPGPETAVTVAWKSPIDGMVKITGRLADADPVGGDGVAWSLEHRSAGGAAALAAGGFANGGSQKISAGDPAKRLDAVAVKAGDVLRLSVSPKANYICDTTVVELTIAALDGAKTWDLTRDIIGNPLAENPYADSLGNPGVWSFAEAPRGAGKEAGLALPAPLLEATASGNRERVQTAAAAFAEGFRPADALNPFRLVAEADEKHLSDPARSALAALRGEVETLKKFPPPPPASCHGAVEGGVPGSVHAGFRDARIHIRGSYARLGESVPRTSPAVVVGPEPVRVGGGSGRMELARWLTDPANPLTARVLVNRIWQHHFGEGLVRTPSNFGRLGEAPSHPELLDHLAAKFVAAGWSIKAMHRELMLSSAYRQSIAGALETVKADPENRLFGRLPRRRLTAEELRDTLLAAAGRLDAKLGGPALRDFSVPRRGLYMISIRSDRSGFGPLFDAADAAALVDKRTSSTVAPQALFLMNHPFVTAQAKALAQRAIAAAANDAGRIGRAYELLYGRPATAEEIEIGLSYLRAGGAGDKAWAEYAQVLMCANELMYVE